MSEIKKFDIDFVERTIRIIEDYNNKIDDSSLEFTLLINCLLGLIIMAHEREDGSFFFLGEKIKDILDIKDLVCMTTLQSKTLKHFLKHFRNAVGHLHINAINNNQEKKRKSIIVWDEYRGKETFPKTNITYDEIKIISLYIANKYLSIKKQHA